MSDFRLLLDTPQTVEWETPQILFHELDREFVFDLDPCATDKNHKCEQYYTIEQNGLAQSWAGKRVFMNPPYGRSIGTWMAKAVKECREGRALVVALVFSRTDTDWWHRFVLKAADEIRYLQGRVRFEREDGKTGQAPCGSAVVIYHPLIRHEA